jgi:hypothetical protein
VPATVTKLETRRRGTGKGDGPTMRAAIDAFLDTPKVKDTPNTLRAYTNVLDRTAEQVGPGRKLADVDDTEIGDALTELWGKAKPATWNRNRAAVGSWLTWCADKQHWAGPALPGSAERQREHNDDTKAVSRSRIDRLCRRRDVPRREKTLWRMLYESASRASAVLALNVEDLDLPTNRPRSPPRAATPCGSPGEPTPPTCCPASSPAATPARCSGPNTDPARTGGPPRTRTTSARKPAVSGSATTAPASCSPTTATASGCTSSGTPRPPTSARPTSPPTSS